MTDLLVPYRIFTHFGDIEVRPCEYLADDSVLLVDKDGHVHQLWYQGRLIDQPIARCVHGEGPDCIACDKELWE